jgi:hypothetical protein
MENLFLLICVGGTLAFILILVGSFYSYSISKTLNIKMPVSSLEE